MDTTSLQSSLADQAANISLWLSEGEHSESVVILKSYKNLGCIINAEKSCSSPRISTGELPGGGCEHVPTLPEGEEGEAGEGSQELR